MKKKIIGLLGLSAAIVGVVGMGAGFNSYANIALAHDPSSYNCTSLHYGIVESTLMGKVYQVNQPITTKLLSSLSDGKNGIDIDTTNSGTVTYAYMDVSTAGYALKLGKQSANGLLTFKLTKSVLGVTVYTLGWTGSVSSLKIGDNIQNVVDATDSFPTKKASASMFQFHPYVFDFEAATDTITIETANGQSGSGNNVVMIASMAFKAAI